MKKLAFIALTALGVSSSQAQLFGPESLAGGAIGAITGAIIGHNSGRHGGEGAAIGAGGGLILGSLVGHERRARYYHDPAYDGYYHYGPYARYAPAYQTVTTQVIQEPRPAAPVQPPPVIREAPRTAMTDANRLFGR